jgi:hypothetical protein
MSLLSSLTSYDDVTLLLLSGLILTVTAGIVSRSEPLAHPLVLGQQSEPSKVRRPTESAVYRNYGVGMYMPVSNPQRVQFRVTILTVLDSCLSAQSAKSRL